MKRKNTDNNYYHNKSSTDGNNSNRMPPTKKENEIRLKEESPQYDGAVEHVMNSIGFGMEEGREEGREGRRERRDKSERYFIVSLFFSLFFFCVVNENYYSVPVNVLKMSLFKKAYDHQMALDECLKLELQRGGDGRK
jgi:hypothetical protein